MQALYTKYGRFSGDILFSNQCLWDIGNTYRKDVIQ